MSGQQHDILLRLQRWRVRLERADDREAETRRTTISRAIDEIEVLRRDNDTLVEKLRVLETIVLGRSSRSVTR